MSTLHGGLFKKQLILLYKLFILLVFMCNLLFLVKIIFFFLKLIIRFLLLVWTAPWGFCCIIYPMGNLLSTDGFLLP